MRRIVDAHHHLWDLGACRYPWLMARGKRRFFGDPAPIQRNYLVADLLSDAAGFELEASVHVQVGVADGDEVRETAWLQQTGEKYRLPSAIVAYCALDRPDAIQVVEAHQRHDRVRGLRQIVGRSAEEDAGTGSDALIDDPAWREHIGMLGDLGLSFDLQLIPAQMFRLAEFLATVPGTRVALCHCGSPWDQSPRGFAAWRDGIGQLASLPNVSCKVSGLGMFDHDWSVDSIRPFVETCIELFGPQRTMFGSNFPVDRLHASYRRVWDAYFTITAGLEDPDLALLFRDTARSFYRIDDAS